MKQSNRAQHQTTKPPDPRTMRGFKSEWYPRADGQEAPTVDTTDRHDRIRLEFLSVYYHLNKSYARLLAARRAPHSKSSEGRTRELAALREVEKVLRDRDALEDRHAPLGVMAEPVVQKGFTIDIKFNLGSRPRSPWDEDLVSSCFIPIPLPLGLKPA